MYRSFVILLLALALLCLTAPLGATVIYVSGGQTGTWSADTVIVTAEVRVPPGGSLNIMPGVEVIFQGYYKFIVNGLLEAVGTQTDSILFTAADTVEGWHSIRFIEANSASRLSYCIVQYGRALGSWPHNYGGGVFCDNSSPTISYNTIKRNTAECGGGIHCRIFSCPEIEGNIISDNSTTGGSGSSGGGGIYVSNSTPTISGNIITGNVASGDGYGKGGGIYLWWAAPLIADNTITGNSAIGSSYGYGGGIYCDNVSGPVISNNTISDNVASGSQNSWGAGICCHNGSEPLIDGNVISRNSAASAANSWGGGISLITYNSSTISQNTISGNSADKGGGIYCYLSSPTIVNTIVESSLGNGGIYFDGSGGASVSYGDFYNNESGNFTGTGIPGGLGYLVAVNANGDSCDIAANIFLDPLFVDPIGGDFHLQADSPCIDAGDPALPLDPDNTFADIGAFCFDQGLDVSLTLVPFVIPIQIPASGGSFEFYLFAHNNEQTTVVTDLWSVAIQPDSSIAVPLLGPATVNLAPGTTGWYRIQNVPGKALPGVYSYIGYIGNYPDIIRSSASFEFYKLTTGSESFVDSWNNTGDSFEAKGCSQTARMSLKETFIVHRAYPNPFNLTAALSYKLQAASYVSLKVFDTAGRQVVELVDGWREAGAQEVTFDGSSLPSGIYFYHLYAGGYTGSGKMVLMK